VENFKAAMSIPAALGLDPTVANSGKTSYFSMRTDNILMFFLFKAYWLMMQLYLATCHLPSSDLIYPLHVLSVHQVINRSLGSDP
jgi:hypothetical protein